MISPFFTGLFVGIDDVLVIARSAHVDEIVVILASVAVDRENSMFCEHNATIRQILDILFVILMIETQENKIYYHYRCGQKKCLIMDFLR